jgi:probable F420-dependent oxidoreductase
MELGVVLWQTDEGVGIAEVARMVERAGLESLFVVGHSHVPVRRRDVIEAEGHELDAHLLDQFTALGAVAAVTERLMLGTAICIAPQYDTIALAKQIATISHLSDGRFVFGIGTGWLFEEMRNHGVDPRTRWDRLAEQVAALRAIWGQDEAEFHGTFVDFDPIWLFPKPSPPPPVLVGGHSDKALRAAALYGDGWIPVITDAGQLVEGISRLRGVCEQVDRPVPSVTACMFGLDDQLLTTCSELGVERCAVLAPTATRAELEEFLAGCGDAVSQ